MSFVKTSHNVLQNQQFRSSLPIDLVGIQNLSLPIRLNSKTKVLSKVSVLVSLENRHTRGIHMSRLYLHLHEYFAKNTLNLFGLKKILVKVIKSQKGLSQSGRLQVKACWPILQKSLKSSFSGWRNYPFYFELNYSKKENKFQYIAGGDILYSSTCPCSAALSRQIIQKDFENAFSEKSSITKKEAIKYLSGKDFLSATPHAQKSKISFKLKLLESAAKKFPLLKVIHDIEKTLGTPVQTAVKQEDEAEFARLNAKNLMFCEDAVRRVAFLFKNKPGVLDYLIRAQHFESLHPFTVESFIVKGVKGGWKA